MSVINMVDIIVLIYSDINDSSLNLVQEYIKQNKLEKRFIIRRYPHKVYPANDIHYFSNEFKKENTLAAYYEFGYKICQKLARFRNGFIFKIDADQLYINNCFNIIDLFLKKDRYKTVINSYGGYNGCVTEDSSYAICYTEQAGILNGHNFDHLIIPNGLAGFVYFYMSITQDHAWEVLSLPQIFLMKSKQYTQVMWYHFSRKFPANGKLIPLDAKQYKIYQEQIYPLLTKANSKYQKLLIKTNS